MALVVTDDKHYKNIANMIRENSDNNVLSVKPEQMASAIQEVADYKESLGLEQGRQEGYQEGKQAEYDAFWDAYQQNGNRTGYRYSFSSGWMPSIFNPKYKITLANSAYSGTGMFFLFGTGAGETFDWRTVADMIDVSGCTDASSMFNSAKINYIDVDLSNATNLFKCFTSEWQITGCTHISVKVSEKCINYNSTFDYCSELTHLFFKEGSVIAANMSVPSATKLVKESIESIIYALWDSASGKTLTLSLTAVKKAFETSPGANDGNISEEWLSLVASKSNWTISLV